MSTIPTPPQGRRGGSNLSGALPVTSNKLPEFSKLKDPEDSTFVSVCKHLFRYSSPTLVVYGPLAPAHDALLARSILATIEFSFGLAFIAGGIFRKFPPQFTTGQKFFKRFLPISAGVVLSTDGLEELKCDMLPKQNPLFIEIQMARNIQQAMGKGRGSYWFGPENFCPMDTVRYVKMEHVIKSYKEAVEQYNEHEITISQQEVHDAFAKQLEVKHEGTGLAARVNRIIESKDVANDLGVKARDDAKAWFSPFDYKKDALDRKSGVFLEWQRCHPWEILNVATLNNFLNYEFEFPALTEQEIAQQKENAEKANAKDETNSVEKGEDDGDGVVV
ncbi:unnamed protein product [Ambrosiozyma monospora]|uniref:Unnamed protein product n=1 Tax=Ambrosiozyma monospora TaxID=43982 RepID=A0ACB5T3R2_AMBMO|nr:unnamed protein product [Ambrosiozyma monospora]